MRIAKNGVTDFKNAVILTHEATTGPAHDLRDFLIKQTENLLFIAHPLLFIPSSFKKSSYWQFYISGEKIKEGKGFHFIFPELILYMKDVLYSLFWIITKIGKTDIFFGINNMNACVGILLKKLGLTKMVIFYSIDYVPKRYQSNLINSIYHRIDKWAVEGSDVAWNLSPRMQEGRREKWRKELGNQITVPMGAWYHRIQKNLSTKTNPHEIIYVGTIIEKQGLDICVEAIRVLKNKIKDIKLTIIGSGPYENVIKELVRKYKLQHHVIFLGYVKSHEDVEKRLSKASLAVALYNPQKDIFTYYADPMKVKTYLACGLPVLITNIPYVAREAQKAGCAIVVNYDLPAITKKIEEFFKDTKKVSSYRRNALAFAKKYDFQLIYSKALKESR